MSYTTITDARIDADSPITFAELSDLRDNPIGIAQASAGAPQIVSDALVADVWEHIETINIAATGHGDNIDFTDAAITDYDYLRIVTMHLAASVTSPCAILTGNGGTFDNGASDYSSQVTWPTSSIALVNVNGPGYKASHDILIAGHNDASVFTCFFGNTFINSGGQVSIAGTRNELAVHDRFRISRGTGIGEFEGGKIVMWGMKR